jgi:hypothetical protein
LTLKPPSVLIKIGVEEGLVAAATAMLKDVPGLQQLVVRANMSQEDWGVLVRGAQQVLPTLKLQLQKDWVYD